MNRHNFDKIYLLSTWCEDLDSIPFGPSHLFFLKVLFSLLWQIHTCRSALFSDANKLEPAPTDLPLFRALVIPTSARGFVVIGIINFPPRRRSRRRVCLHPRWKKQRGGRRLTSTRHSWLITFQNFIKIRALGQTTFHFRSFPFNFTRGVNRLISS